MKEFINEIDKSKLRGLQRGMHLCAADCHADTLADMDQVHRCVERCQQPAQRAQQYVQSELEHFQESLSRCVLQCQDEVKDKVVIEYLNQVQALTVDYSRLALILPKLRYRDTENISRLVPLPVVISKFLGFK